ncbi:ABC transporter ATP-binding protein [Myceligenerans pegani]|uniref:ABC transporter ATP-binding protein n=1 Tax=Myceligenerans pegani TaxID=2776917 RepID=A0ABR9MUP3_9MICO|nr:ABC transporter ATP-binding protein [Myceligenerans sp. TRM 65318]MBE1875085.1 ABC transporter ATP-binding protein [Myceligenerans sp. TRM 65318]MBE3017356.1 ABC transporter ATP-binding protein [Myceligenerans sp. TRM 65318]
MTTVSSGVPAIEIAGLDKSFGSVKALDGLDLTVPTGEVAGFLGPNGAGKSTTIRVLLGLLRSDAGVARMFGRDVWHDAVELHRHITYVPGDVSLWPNLTGGECIDYLTRLRGTADKKALRARRAELLERFELDPRKKARTYSKGNRQKVALVAAFLSDADLYILDEPTAGLDPLMESVFTDYVREAKEAGRSVLLSSHILSEVEKVCDTVTIIRNGTAVEHGTLDELRHLTRSNVTAVVGSDPAPLARLDAVNDLQVTAHDGGTRVTFDADNADIAGVLRAVTALGVHSITVTPPSLEELFMRHYGDVIEADEVAAEVAADGVPSDRAARKAARRAAKKAGVR